MKISMKLLPPSPVSACVPVDLRLGAQAREVAAFRVTLSGSLQAELLLPTAARDGQWQVSLHKLDFRNHPGTCRLTAIALDAEGHSLGEAAETLELYDSSTRSTGLIDGAWCGLYHWSEKEGRLWNDELKQFTSDDWRALVHDMHDVGMNIIVLQELFRNEMYRGKHDIAHQGYVGCAFYPSQLFPGRMPIACADPVEAILSAADELGMAVLPGVGMYAWFDFTAGSLEWHKRVAAELFERYGHHRSFYGWYVSEEVFGNLHYGENSAEEIVRFFHEFRLWVNRFDPTRPVMLAPNCFDMPKAREHWERLSAELDILCPFAFHRMEPDDIGPDNAIKLFQEIADANGAHLWLDMEIFLFTSDLALYPRPIDQIAAELAGFQSFEKILCYQYPGLLNAPRAARKPGGDDTVKLYTDYQRYFEQKLHTLKNLPSTPA